MKKLVLLFILCIIALAGCGEENKPQTQQNAENMPVEQKFMTVAVGHYVPHEDQSVARAKVLIDRAAQTYGISKELVADQAYTAYKVGKEDGLKVAAMEVLEAATLAYVAGSGMDFAKSCVMYLTLRKSDMPHAEAMMGMKGIASTIRDMGVASKK